jgi:hypothetical protein
MRLAEPGAAVDEQRVVGLGRRLGHRHGGGVGEAVGRADHEPLEGVLRRQLGMVGAPGHDHRPRLLVVAGVLQLPHGDPHLQRPARDPGEGRRHGRRVALLDPFLDELVGHGQDQRVAGDGHRPRLGQPGLVGSGAVERIETGGPDRRRVVMELLGHSLLAPFRHPGSLAPHSVRPLCDTLVHHRVRRNLHIHTPIHRCGEPDPCGRGCPTGPGAGRDGRPSSRGQRAVTGKPGQTFGPPTEGGRRIASAPGGAQGPDVRAERCLGTRVDGVPAGTVPSSFGAFSAPCLACPRLDRVRSRRREAYIPAEYP